MKEKPRLIVVAGPNGTGKTIPWAKSIADLFPRS